MLTFKQRETLSEIQKKAALFNKVKRFDAAEKHAKSYLGQGFDGKIYNLLGVIMQQQGLYSEAMGYFKKAYELDKEDPQTAITLVAALCDLSQYDKANQIYDNLIKKDAAISRVLLDKIADHHRQTAEVYQSANLHAEAISEYTKALTYTNNDEIRLSLAKLYVTLQFYDKALSELDNILRRNQQHARAHVWQGIVHHKKGLQQSAKNAWNLAAELHPNDPLTKLFKEYAQGEDFESAAMEDPLI